MVTVPRGQSWDEAAYPGRRNTLVYPGGSIMQLGNDRQGFGSMRIFPGPVAGANITPAAWQNVAAFNELNLPGELCTLNPATGRFSFQSAGIWRVSLFMSIRHNNAGAYREMNARFFNMPDSVALPAFQIPTGQAAQITNFAFSAVYNVPESILDKDFILQLQAGPGMNYSNVSYETMNISLSLEGVF